VGLLTVVEEKVPVPAHEYVGAGVLEAVTDRFREVPHIGLLLLAALEIVGLVFTVIDWVAVVLHAVVVLYAVTVTVYVPAVEKVADDPVVLPGDQL
jgi:hypothetical protein